MYPSIVLENIPYNINKRLSTISSNKEYFDEEKMTYQKAILDAGYSYDLSYTKGFQKRPKQYCGQNKGFQNNNVQSTNQTNRSKVKWFNPPFNLYCATNVGKIFRDIIKKHFSGGDDLSKLFNKNRLKISYSCLPNIKSKISAHNKLLLSGNPKPNRGEKNCNCQKSRECPLKGNCIIENSVYKAQVLKEGQQGTDGHAYVGLHSGLFKLRLANHEQSFKDRTKAKCELAKYIWQMKDRGINNYKINWQIIAVEKCYDRKTGKCNLFQREKLEILRLSHIIGTKLINKIEEILRPCIHRFKHLLGNLDTHNTVIPEIPSIPDIPSIPGNQKREGFTRSGRRWRNLENV